MRWLFLKDLQILRRSPLMVALLVAYPVVISVLIGLALSRGPEKPKVAFVNEVPAGESSFRLGSQEIDASRYADRVLVLADGEVLFAGTPGDLEALVGGDPRDFEAAFVRFLHDRGH